jgi:hypothetical protein
MSKKGIVLLIIGIFLLSFASASLDISGLEKIYNYGDKMQFTITTNPVSVYGFFEVTLICNNNSLAIYKIPANEDGFPIGQENKYSNYISVDKSILGALGGNCFLQANLGSETAKTENIEITPRILVSVALDKENYNPGEQINMVLKATKANGQLLQGFLEVSGDVSSSNAVENGEVQVAFQLPADIAAGNHFMNMNIYERGKDNLALNYENITSHFIVNQIPSKIELSLNELEIVPGNESLEIMPQIFDQSRIEMNGSALNLKLIAPDLTESDYSAQDGIKKIIAFETNQTFGNYKIIASVGDIKLEKEFRVLEVEKISLDIIGGDNILVVKNIGNVVYNKTIDIAIGNKTEKIENIRLGLGEEKRFRLNAPDGEYDVSVSDGEIRTGKRLLLTGAAVSVTGQGFMDLSKLRIVLYFLIVIILALALVLLARNGRKILPFFSRSHKRETFKTTKTFIGPMIGYETKAEKKEKEERKKEMSEYLKVQRTSGGEAESSAVLEGRKYTSSIVSIKIHNFNELRSGGKEEINKIIERLKEQRAMVELRDTHIIAIVSPLVTKKFDNETIAVKIGFDLKQELEAYNRRAAEKIDFNIGIHAGDLLSSVANGKLKYTSLGNTMLLARKISDSDSGKLLISESVKAKMMRNIKTDGMRQVGSSKAYSVNAITDIDANQEKLKDLLKRMDYKG